MVGLQINMTNEFQKFFKENFSITKGGEGSGGAREGAGRPAGSGRETTRGEAVRNIRNIVDKNPGTGLGPDDITVNFGTSNNEKTDFSAIIEANFSEYDEEDQDVVRNWMIDKFSDYKISNMSVYHNGDRGDDANVEVRMRLDLSHLK